ncbi:hypothetical protein QBC37DRAFT_433757 [Rhypophila decipiens]|uniref:Myb-like domain-containing protein n=1 Tax=Rhypophila decipiens TaxID=261697 RepID=A0AAN6XX26_9PEZI|nr:hypothetical protein QBC37DRAFT_433757 [Rhypophila decipiens]
MLLPSALSCDASQPPLTRLQTALFASPPASPPQLSPQNAIGNIFSTCRSLQSLLASPAPIHAIASEPITPPASSHAQQPTPPMEHAPSPMRLRLRSRKTDAQSTLAPGGGDLAPRRKRIVKRSAPPRGPNKRRRAIDDEKCRDDEDSELDADLQEGNETQETLVQQHSRPQTPKRARIAPEIIPLGLERSDYHGLHITNALENNQGSSRLESNDDDFVVEVDGETWSTEEDRILVELVLEKLKLTKSDWQDCARSLGKDRNSVGRRWKSLMINGDVGIKRSSRRSKLHGTWR